MKTLDAWNLYKKSNSLSPYTVSVMENTFRQLSVKSQELPVTAFEVNEYLASLQLADITRHLHRRHIVSLYKFLINQMDYPDFLKKIIKIKVEKTKRRYLNPIELAKVFQACKTPVEKVLFFIFIDSPCREGELGRHPTKTGEYPGLRVEMITENTLDVEGKTGKHSYRLHPQVREMLLSIASSNGQVFTTSYSPDGMTAKAIQNMMREVFIRSGIGGNKLAPHTLRHSAASLIAKSTHSVLDVMAVLQQSETKTAMGYIHDAEEELKHKISPLQILGDTFAKPKPENHQELLAIDAPSDTTALVPYNPSNQEVEKVDATVDLSEELFPVITETQKPIRAVLTIKRLSVMRKAFVYYAKNAPLDGTTGELSQMMKAFFRG
jgi:integrase